MHGVYYGGGDEAGGVRETPKVLKRMREAGKPVLPHWGGRKISWSRQNASEGDRKGRATEKETAENIENAGKSGIIIVDKQLGHKVEKHMKRWKMNVSSAKDKGRKVYKIWMLTRNSLLVSGNGQRNKTVLLLSKGATAEKVTI